MEQPCTIWGAAQRGDVELVKLMLDAGESADATDEELRTLLSIASGEGHLDVVMLLLERGATVGSLDHFLDEDALFMAAQDGRHEVVAVLIEYGADVNRTDNEGLTALFVAAEEGHSQVVELLLKAGANVDQAIFDDEVRGDTPLMAASECGHLDTVKLLLAAGANVNLTRDGAFVALNSAAANGHIEIVEELLNAGALVNGTNSPPLCDAMGNNRLEVAKLLLERGADIEASARRSCPLSNRNRAISTRPDPDAHIRAVMHSIFEPTLSIPAPQSKIILTAPTEPTKHKRYGFPRFNANARSYIWTPRGG